jgi:hypothetical protein
MRLTKEQLDRVFRLYEGFGWKPGMVPPEINAVDDGRDGPTLEVRVGGYSIHVNHMGQVIPPAATAPRSVSDTAG